jgi:predicted nucleic acid-binding protein
MVIGELRTQLVVSDLHPLAGIVGDPDDEMILACTVAASTPHVVARDEDLLSLGNYKVIAIVTPETFLTLLRNAESSGA